MRIYFVTSSEDKRKEVNAVMKKRLHAATTDVHEIQSLDVKEVVKAKAISTYQRLRKPVVVEDTGLYVEAWNGFPGALVKFMIKSIGYDGMAGLVQKERNKNAYSRTVAALYDGKRIRFFEGITKGRIVAKPRGKVGFGFDFILQPDGMGKTLSEMGTDNKNKFSSRGKAFKKLDDYLHSA